MHVYGKDAELIRLSRKDVDTSDGGVGLDDDGTYFNVLAVELPMRPGIRPGRYMGKLFAEAQAAVDKRLDKDTDVGF